MKPTLIVLILLVGTMRFGPSESLSIHHEESNRAQQVEDDPPLTRLGNNNNGEIPESSGLSPSSFVENAFWTINDSSHPCDLFLLRTTGELIGRVKLSNAKNVDWEAMGNFRVNGVPYLIVADVGDNGKSRSKCQIYLLPEPDLSTKGKSEPQSPRPPIQKRVQASRLDFTYPGGARDCEAVAVDQTAKQIWLVEKVHFSAPKSESPGIYVLPLTLNPDRPQVARRISDFPIRNVTGMAFSDDGKHLIIRNYLNAHLYSKTGNESWESIVSKTKPKTVILPLQRQGEAVCFTRDSKSIILTSETKNQPIWRVSLRSYFAPSADDHKPDLPKSSSK